VSANSPATDGLDDFRDVFLEYHPRLFRYFRSLGFAPEDADDLCQAALLNVYRGRGNVRDATLFAPWVYSVARNVARDAWRKRKDARAESLEDRDVEGRAPSAEREVVEKEKLDRVRVALAALPSRMRACFLLRVQEELGYDEIAERLSLSAGTVKVQVWNARRRLREVLS
jgi:RNA polymerase sigma-70 factor (ECF subfamily)